eukprot:5410480-Amphidinium_carterae.1
MADEREFALHGTAKSFCIAVEIENPVHLEHIIRHVGSSKLKINSKRDEQNDMMWVNCVTLPFHQSSHGQSYRVTPKLQSIAERTGMVKGGTKLTA